MLDTGRDPWDDRSNADDPPIVDLADEEPGRLEGLLRRALGVPDDDAASRVPPPTWRPGPTPDRSAARGARRTRPGSPVRRGRTVASVLVVVVLAVALFVFSRRDGTGASVDGIQALAPAPERTSRPQSLPADGDGGEPTTTSAEIDGSSPPSGLLPEPLTRTCTTSGTAGSAVVLTCPPPAGMRLVRYEVHVTRDALERRYRMMAGEPGTTPERGAPACAKGEPDARSWSRAAAPRTVVGWYSCRISSGRAEMWWTDRDALVLGHAVRTDADLATLFEWWRRAPDA